MKYIRLLYNPILIIFALSSCSTKNFVYLHENSQTPNDTLRYTPAKTLYHIQSGDVLYINFHSVLSDAEKYFSYSESGMDEKNPQLSEETMYINQHVVNDSGYIKIPVIGSVYVLRKTVSNIEKLIEKEAQRYLTDATVKVKLVSYKITFLGEFGSPGEKFFYRDDVNIMDAIANAGDLTYDGDRKNIRIIRQTPDGLETFSIDLSDTRLLDSEEYFLKPNDIVYAEPLPRKVFRLRSADYSIILVLISSTLALTSLIISVNN